MIGITSFLLIGYWWDRSAACNAATQALIVNRIGDCSFTLALMLTAVAAGTLDLESLILIFNSSNETLEYSTISYGWESMLASWTGVFLVVAAFGKSAQFLLHTWLPLSMEGPTPVSALLHAATLVAGGTYLLLRCSAIVGASTMALLLAAVFGTITAILAATTALFQYDAKRIIAYSTMSQFGYLTASIGLGQTSSTLFHLSSHSGFKALLFITAGGIIHATNDEQDIRKLGGLISSLPFTYCGMLIGSLSLIATPYLSGFYSKDLLLELGAAQWSITSSWMWILGSLVAGITACYSIRLIAYIFLGTPSGPKKTYEWGGVQEQPSATVISIVALSILAILFGFFAREAIVGLGNFTMGGKESIMESYLIEADFGLSLWKKNLPMISTLIGTFIGIVLFIGYNSSSPKNYTTSIQKSFYSLDYLNKNRNEQRAGSQSNTSYHPSFSISSMLSFNVARIIMVGLNNKWWIDALYARIISWPGLQLGLIASKWIDRGVIELLGPEGLSRALTPTIGIQAFSIAHITTIPASTSSYLVEGLHVPVLNAKSDFNSKDLKFIQNSLSNNNTNLWKGTTLPDYSAYVVVFILISIITIGGILPIINNSLLFVLKSILIISIFSFL